MSNNSISPFQLRIQQPESNDPEFDDELSSSELTPRILHLVNQIAAKKDVLGLNGLLMMPYLANYQEKADCVLRHSLRKKEEELLKNVNESLPMLKRVELLCVNQVYSELGDYDDWLCLRGIKSFWSSPCTIDVYIASDAQNTQDLLVLISVYFGKRAYGTTNDGHILLQKTNPIDLSPGVKIPPRMFSETALYDVVIKGPDKQPDLKNSIQLAFGDVKMNIRICATSDLDRLDELVEYSYNNPYFSTILYDLMEWMERHSIEDELKGIEFLLEVKEFYDKIKLVGWENFLSNDLKQLLVSDFKYMHLIKPPVSDPLNLIVLSLELLCSNELNLILSVFQNYVLGYQTNMVNPCLELSDEGSDEDHKKIDEDCGQSGDTTTRDQTEEEIKTL